MGISFYCGVTGERQWNSHPVSPGALACVSPVHGRNIVTRRDPSPTAVPQGTMVLQDSGAFSDSWNSRLSCQDALARQLSHAVEFGYIGQVEAVCSYDLLIDEKWSVDGTRHKQRWSELEAENAVQITIAAAKYLSEQRSILPGVPVLNCQGVTPQQYLRCAAHVIDTMESGDWLGLGGWCVLGIFQKVAALQECFRQTINRVMPYAAKRGVRRAHIFGVIYPDALGKLLHIADEYGIAVSTDSMSPGLAPTRGQWGYGEWRDNNHVFAPLATRGLERAEHVRLTREWLSRLDKTRWYQSPKDKRVMVTVGKPEQLRMAI